MRYNKFFKKIIVASFLGAMTLVIARCYDTTKEGIQEQQKEFQIPEVGMEGGYEIDTTTLYCTTLVDNDYKYSKFESKTGNHTVEYYASPTEMVIIDKNKDGNKYYRKTLKDVDQTYTNPLKAVYDDLKGLDFERVEEKEDKGLKVFQAIKTTEVIEQQQIGYTEYNIKMKWTDEKDYSFTYYEYEDNSTLISAEAPDEINDRLTPETKWVIDVEKQCVRNMETNKEVGFTVIGVKAGKALSPDESNAETKTVQSYVFVYVNQETNLIEKLQYSESEDVTSTAVSIINDVNIVKPEITADMTEMRDEEVSLSMMLINTIGSLI